MIVSIKLFVSYIIPCQLANTMNAPSIFFFFLLYVALKKQLYCVIHQYETEYIILFKNLRKCNIFLPHSLSFNYSLSLSISSPYFFLSLSPPLFLSPSIYFCLCLSLSFLFFYFFLSLSPSVSLSLSLNCLYPLIYLFLPLFLFLHLSSSFL